MNTNDLVHDALFPWIAKRTIQEKTLFAEELVSEKLFAEASLGVWGNRPFVQVYNLLDSGILQQVYYR